MGDGVKRQGICVLWKGASEEPEAIGGPACTKNQRRRQVTRFQRAHRFVLGVVYPAKNMITSASLKLPAFLQEETDRARCGSLHLSSSLS